MNYFQGCSLLLDKWIKDLALEHYSTDIEHDYLINSIAASFDSMYFYNKPLFQYRLHEKNSIGAQYDTQTKEEHLQRANTLKIRTQNAHNALNVLNIIRLANSDYYQENQEEFSHMSAFLINIFKHWKIRSFLSCCAKIQVLIIHLLKQRRQELWIYCMC